MSSQFYKLAIPNPCSQSWDSMIPTNTGKHCEACNKTVLDFSRMKDEEIQNYFSLNQNNPVCGRFKKDQIDRIRIHIPHYILYKPISLWKKYLLILLICFGSSIFSVDVVVGSSSNNFAQTQELKIHKKQRANKRHKKRKKIIFSFETCDIMILGGTVTVPTYPILDHGKSALGDNLNEKRGNQISNNPDSNSNLEMESDHKNKTPQDKKSNDKIEFIIPPALLLRRKLIKRT